MRMPVRLPIDRSASTAVVVLCLLIGLAGPGTASAELVVLVDGGVLKVRSYERVGEQMRLDLPSGGSLRLSVLRIDRILEDEIVEDPDEGLLGGPVEIAFTSDHRVPETPYGELIFETARRHDLNPHLVAAMVRAESAFDPLAVSRKGASGLLQLMPSTAQRFGVELEEIFDPERNLEAGVRYLRWLSERFDGDLPLMLAGYNAGEATVDRYDGIPPYAETRTYIRRIYSSLGAE